MTEPGFAQLHPDERELSGVDVVDQHWPFDGPHSPTRTASALDAAARLVRYACNATSTPDGLGSAPEVYQALGGLTEATDRLPQLLEQTSEWAARLENDDRLGHDQHKTDGPRPAWAASNRAADRLSEASALAEQLYNAISSARSELAHLYHRPTPLAEEGQ